MMVSILLNLNSKFRDGPDIWSYYFRYVAGYFSEYPVISCLINDGDNTTHDIWQNIRYCLNCLMIDGGHPTHAFYIRYPAEHLLYIRYLIGYLTVYPVSNRVFIL